MCECGCEMNARRYTFPAPGKSFYLLVLSPPCTNCVAPPGVSIELIEPSNVLWAEYRRGEWVEGPLKFEDWRDTKGVRIATGLIREEFVKACSKHLVGIGKEMFGDDGKIDADGAEVILEEMYDDSHIRPAVLE